MVHSEHFSVLFKAKVSYYDIIGHLQLRNSTFIDCSETQPEPIGNFSIITREISLIAFNCSLEHQAHPLQW